MTIIRRPPPPPSKKNDPYKKFLDKLEGSDRDAFIALTDLFTTYGLGTLAPKIYDFLVQGYSADTITILLQNTDEYKQRFAGNEARKKAGLAVLSPAEYLSVERAYKDLFRAYGIPVGLYDQPNDLSKYIGADVSPTEMQNRLDIYSELVQQADPSTKQALKQFYNLDDGSMLAYAIDPKRALPLLQRQAAAAEAGGAALRHGLKASKGRIEDYVLEGVTQAEFEQGFENIDRILAETKKLAAIEHEGYTQTEAEEEFLGGLESAKRKRRTLNEKETARFSGGSGAVSGSLNRKRSGSY